MQNVKEELKQVIVDVMLPESEAYLEELNDAIKENANEDTIAAKQDIEVFLEELKTILEVIEENKISNDDAKAILEKINTMISEHEA